MNEVKVETKSQEMVKTNASVLAAFAVAIILPFFLHLQLVTGPIINAMLIIVTIVLGLRWGLILSIIPSIMALAGGLLLPFLTPVIPFIILSNMLMVGTLSYFYEQDAKQIDGYWKGVSAGSLIKSLFLMICGFLVLKFYHNPQAVKLAVTALGVIQLVTSLAGGVIAYLFLKFIKLI